MSSPNPTTLQQLRCLDRSSSNFHNQLTNVLYGEGYERSVLNLQGSDLVSLVDYLDKALDILDPASPGFRKCLRELRSICGARMTLPTSYTLSSSLLNIDRRPVASGGPGDVYEGTLNGSKVCVKRIRVYSEDGPEKATRTLYQRAVLWKRLEHQNIVPLLGVTSTPLQLISKWMTGGDLTEYIKKHPNADRLSLLRDITSGLHHLHSRGMVHGDLKGPNVLVDTTGCARITDFGLAIITQDLDSGRSISYGQGYTARWTAPEILKEEGTYSKEADIFSFAMVMIEVFTGTVPFSNSRPTAAIAAIMGGKRPPRPTHVAFTDELWILMQQCWDQNPHSRPEVSNLFEVLRGSDPASRPSQRPPRSTITLPPKPVVSHAVPEARSFRPWSNLLQRLSHLDRSSSLLHSELSNILYGEEYKQCVGDLQNDDLLWLVDYLDQALDVLDPDGPAFRKCLRELRKVCGTRVILPTSYIISPPLLDIGLDPVASGGFADVYQGTLAQSKVCIKRVRIYSMDGPEKAVKMFYQEAVVWKYLAHPNIVPFLGITPNPLQIILEWMPGGDLREYIRRYPDADRLGLVSDVAQGLYYLHSHNIIHGDLKGPNILVDVASHARLTDFGLATVTQNPDSIRSASVDRGHAVRWTAPEVLKEEGTYSKEADIFSFAMVTIEAFTGTVPFDGVSSPATIYAIISGVRPPRPTHPIFTDELWRLVKHCWGSMPHSRPTISEVSKVLSGSEPPPISIHNLQSNFGSRNRDAGVKDHNLELSWEPEDGDEENYRPGGQRDNRGASGDTHYRGGQSMPLPHSPSLDHLAQYNQSRTDLHDGKRIGSRPRLSDMGIETLSRRPSRRDTIDANADEDQGSPHEQDNHTQQPNQPVNGGSPGGQKQLDASANVAVAFCLREKKHGVWCRLKRTLLRWSKLELVPRIKQDTQDVMLNKKWSKSEPSGIHLSNNVSLDSPPHHYISKTNPHGGSRTDSHHNLRTGTRSYHQSLPNLAEMSHGPLHEKNNAGQLDPQMDGKCGGKQEGEGQNVLENTLDRSNPPAWRRSINFTLAAHEPISLITTIFSDHNQTEMVRQLSGDDAQTFIDMIDEALDSLAPQIRRRCLRAVYRICGHQALIPQSLKIPLCYNPMENPLCCGGFAEVWKGQYQSKEVAVKVLKVYARNDLGRMRRRFCREVVVWKTLRHPNVLPLLGVTMTEDRLIMVSEWMVKGNIRQFMKAENNADRLGLLRDATRGLIYMHDQGIVHGDLKGVNILINNSGHACLADFSLLTITSDQSTVMSSWVEGGTVQWMSPELLDPERFSLKRGRPTKESDCYALGMVVYEVLTGQTPFAPSKPPAVIWKVLEGQRPGRPQGEKGELFTDAIWGILELCWKPLPTDRTSVKAVLLCLEETPSLPRVSSGMGVAETDTDDQSGTTASDSGQSIAHDGNGLQIPP